MNRVPVLLDDSEFKALQQAARRDLRSIPEQARYIIRQYLALRQGPQITPEEYQ